MDENNEESTQTEEDELIPLVGEEEGKETKPEEGEEETETPSESSTEKKPETETDLDEDATSVKSEEPEEVKKETWDVEGLKAQKERLAEEIQELRKERRTIKGEPEKPVFVEKEELADVAPADIELIEKVLKAKGYVRKDDVQNLTYAERLNTEQNTWLETHPEYLPKNDPKNIRWDELKDNFDRYYKMPSNPKDIRVILDSIHSQISHPSLPKKSSAEVAASKERLKVVSKAAGGGGGTKSVIKKNAGIDRSAFRDFSDEELDEMGV